MSSKKRLRKSIESYDKQISLHLEKIRIAEQEGDEGLKMYHEREIRNFELNKRKDERNLLPKKKRKKS